MRKIMVLVGSAFVLGVAFWLFAPMYVKDKVVGLLTASTAARQCFNYHKESFNDPHTAYMDGSYIWTKENELNSGSKLKPNPIFEKYDAIVNISVYAKNRMGGYVNDYLECPLVDGKFDRNAAFDVRLDSLKRKNNQG